MGKTSFISFAIKQWLLNARHVIPDKSPREVILNNRNMPLPCTLLGTLLRLLPTSLTELKCSQI